MIAIDWGTTQFRARRLAPDGTVLDRVDAQAGILGVTDFPAALQAQIGAWLADGEWRVLMCGMVGSRQGWVEAPYLPCPAGLDDIARHLTPVPFQGATILLAPGLSTADESGVPEVMRGEETQLLGAMAAIGPEGVACLPGTHAKWARIERGRIAGFTTFLTGEAFAALRDHTILGRLMNDAPHHPGAFARGVGRSGERGGVLHHLFGVRALGLMARLDPAESASYLSGLLIGHEVRAVLPLGALVHLIGAPALCNRYEAAIAELGGASVRAPGEPAITGLSALGERARWN